MTKDMRTRPWLWPIAFIGVIVPGRLRADWRQEWIAELRYRETLFADWERLNWRTKLNLIFSSLGAFWDALWMQGHRWEDAFVQDLRYGTRMLSKHPSSAFVAITALALGIGANTAIFSIVNAVLFRQLPYKDSERLMMLWESDARRGGSQTGFSYPRFAFLRDQQKSFDALAAYTTRNFSVMGHDGPMLVQGAHISGDFFGATGVGPTYGRTFTPEEDQPGAAPVVMLGHELWLKQLGGNPNVVGQSITVDGQLLTVVGIMPAGFKLFEETIDLWLPRVYETNFLSPQSIQRGAIYLAVFGRLKSGVSLDQARAALNLTNERYQQAYAGNSDAMNGMGVGSLHQYLVGDIRSTLLLLLGAVAFVLLIACANVANLMLARGAARRKEVAVRKALGATYGRLMRQTLTESILLSVIGGAFGLLLAFVGLKLVVGNVAPEVLPRAGEIQLDGWMLIFTLLISVVTGVVFGVAPALFQARTNSNESLKAARGDSGSRGRHRLHRVLAISEIALTLVLLIGAGVLIRSFLRLRNIDTGINPSGVLTMQISLPSPRYANADQQTLFYDQLLEKVKNLPGVTAAGTTTRLHLDEPGGTVRFFPEGQADLGLENPQGRLRVVSQQYFETLGIPLVQGRMFNDRDKAAGPRVMLINESMARRSFPNQNPVGKRITYTSDRLQCEVVGVIRNARTSMVERQSPEEMYVPYSQRNAPGMTLVVRGTSSDPLSLSEGVRRQVQAVDKQQPVAKMRTMEQVIAATLSQPRFTALLLLIFAAVALALATIGIYGVMSFSVTERTKEFGILMAVGAQQRDVLKMVLRQGLVLTVIGVGIGLLTTIPLRGLLTQMYGVSPTDPLTLVCVSLLLMTVSLVACYIPARRATRVDPLEAIRYE